MRYEMMRGAEYRKRGIRNRFLAFSGETTARNTYATLTTPGHSQGPVYWESSFAKFEAFNSPGSDIWYLIVEFVEPEYVDGKPEWGEVCL